MNVDASEFILRALPADEVAAPLSFEELLRMHERQVLNTALRMLGNLHDAQDTSQEVFLKLYRNLGKLKAEAISPWLYRVTLNACYDAAKKRKRMPVEFPDGFEAASRAQDPASASESAEFEKRMMAAIARLPEKERAALVLREIEGLTSRQAADILGCAEATVRSQVCDARARLRAWLERSGG
jgi:RNA polymerase sigma-70 factor (ECF subfamily)